MTVELAWPWIIGLTLFTFFFGHFWYGPLFGKLWMRIHHGDKTFSKEEMAKMMEGLWKIMATELIMTFITLMTLDFLVKLLPSFAFWHVALLVWLGFVVPSSTSVVLWGNDEKRWMPVKIGVIAFHRLVILMLSAYVFAL